MEKDAMKIGSRTSRIESSKTLQVKEKALQLKAQGVDVVDLTAGEPDFRTPDFISKAGIEAINKGKVFRYITKPWNKDELRQTIDDAFESFELKVKNKNQSDELEKTNKQLEQELYDCSQKIEAQ